LSVDFNASDPCGGLTHPLKSKTSSLTTASRRGHLPGRAAYPKTLDTQAKRALYDNLGKDEALALAMDVAVRENKQDDWRGNAVKVRKVMLAIKHVLEDLKSQADLKAVLELVKNQDDY
jgi:type I restriction enzyme R subunit